MTPAFDKSTEAIPGRAEYVFLAACGASPLPADALARLSEGAQRQAASGALVFDSYDGVLERLHASAGQLLDTAPDNISLHRNSSEALSLVAGGYPFQPGDEVITYVHEYPANYYPWRNLTRRDVRLVELSNVVTPGNEACGTRPCALSLDELERRISNRTRVVALSHVQFTSGFAVDVGAAAEICRAHGIDLVLDTAQSLGAVPVEPERYGLAAAVSSGWKWLLGPLGTGLMYSSPTLRERLDHVLVGAETMTQGTDYLDHSWQPHHSAKRFEYGTSSPPLAAALDASIRGVHLRYGVAAIRAEIIRLQDLLIAQLDPGLFTPVVFPDANRSGILSVICRRRTPEQLVQGLREHRFVVSARAGYLRIAPHFFVTDEEIERLADTMKRIGS